MSETDDIWLRVNLALTLLEHDPKGLKGICFRLRSGPVKTRVMAHIEKIAPRIIKLHPNMSDEQLFGGLDVVATLQHQKLVHSNGLMRCDGWHVLQWQNAAQLIWQPSSHSIWTASLTRP